jgi:predicted dehydrogenase
MLDAARRANRILMIGHVLRFWPAYRYLHRVVSSNEYGDVRSATFTRYCGLPDWSPWLLDPSRSGGAIFDLLIHDLDQILLLFGPPASVRAKTFGNADAVSASLLYPGGPEVRLQGGWLASGTAFSMGFQVRTVRAQLDLTPDGLILADAKGQRRLDLDETDAFADEIGYFQDCCENNREPSRCPPEQSAAAVKLAHAVMKARSSEEEVKCEL